MAWHYEGARAYYYRSQRVKGRNLRRYVGTGQIAELAAASDHLHWLNQAIEAHEQKAEETRLQATETAVVDLCDVSELVGRASLVVSGYRRHTRGEWRLHRGPSPNN
jgi:hypothetical protein